MSQLTVTLTDAAGASVNSRTLLAAISSPAAGQAAFLTEANREGLFVWSASNLSTQVALDTQQGIYVPPASDVTGASGAWVRKFSGNVDVCWFGAAPDGQTNAVDSAPAILVADAVARHLNKTLSFRGIFRVKTAIILTAPIHWRFEGTH